MSREQTYEELMGRVKELENEVVKLKQEAKGLSRGEYNPVQPGF